MIAETGTAANAKRPRPDVLLIGHPDGFVELFASEPMHTKFVMAPDVSGDELLVDRWIDSQLSKRHRNIHLSGCLEQTGLIRSIKPSDLFYAKCNMELLRHAKTLCREGA